MSGGYIKERANDDGAKIDYTIDDNDSKMKNSDKEEKEKGDDKESEEEEHEKNGTKKAGLADEPDRSGIPVDKGYSWVICCSASLLQMLVFGHNRCISTLFLDLREEFQESQTIMSLTMSMFALSLAVSSLVSSNVIIKLFPPRPACVLAAILSSTSVLVASQSQSIGLWLASYVFRGLSCGCLLIIPISLVGYYFKGRRALASSIASMGMVFGNIMFPPLATMLQQTFGLRGTLLIMCGIELQMIPVAMLLRPHTFYTKKHKRRQETMALKDVVSVEIEPLHDEPNKCTSNLQDHAKNTHHMIPSNTADKYQQPVEIIQNLGAKTQEELDEEEAIKLYNYSSSAHAFSNLRSEPGNIPDIHYPDIDNNHHYDYELNTTANITNHSNIIKGDNRNDQTRTRTILQNQEEQKHPLLPAQQPASILMLSSSLEGNASSPSGKSQSYLTPKDVGKIYRLNSECSRPSQYSSQTSIAALGSLVNVSYIIADDKKNNDKDQIVIKDYEEEKEEVDEDSDKRPTFADVCQLKVFFDVSLLKLWVFRMLAIFMATSAATILLTVYLPVLAVKAGMTKAQGSLLLTIGGSVDLVTRPFIGWLADKRVITKEKMIAFSLFMVAIITQFGRLFTTFPLFIMYTIIVCIFSGFRANLFSALVFDYFGPVRAPKVFGLSLLCTTVFMAANHPVFGALIDITGGHVIPLHYAGGVVAFSACVLLLQPVFLRLDRRNKEKENQETEVGGKS